MNRMRKVIRIEMACLVMALLLGLSPAVATAQSVRGKGVFPDPSHGAKDGGNLFQGISVNAWIDADGVAQGHISWIGSVFQTLPDGSIHFGGPSNPAELVVTDVFFIDNTAYVTGVVVASPQGELDGDVWFFTFTDNSAIDEPDEISILGDFDDVPVAGNLRVRN
jgi:hypothetical protein